MQPISWDDISPEPRSEGYALHAVAALTHDIRTDGILRQCCPAPGGYVIAHGGRRWRAALAAGLEPVPAYLVAELG